MKEDTPSPTRRKRFPTSFGAAKGIRQPRLFDHMRPIQLALCPYMTLIDFRL
jgi:hypothetical protein